MGWELLKWQVLEGKQRGWEAAEPSPPLMLTRNDMPVTAWAPWEIQQTTDSLYKALSNRFVQEDPSKNIGIVFPHCFAPFLSPSAATDDSFPLKLESGLGQVTKMLWDEAIEEGRWMHQVSGSWRSCGFFPDRDMRAFITFLLLAHSEWAWRGACWQSPSCIPNYAVQLSWVTSPLQSGPEQSPSALLPLHRADVKVTSPLEWEGLGWIESLHERTPKLGYPLQSLSRICLNMLFGQSYWLASTDPIWSHRSAMWGQTGGSMRICRVGFIQS